MGLQDDGSRSNKFYALFSSLRVWSHATIGNLNSIIPSSRCNQAYYEKNAELRLHELERLDEKLLAASQSIKLYQAWMVGAFDKKVWQWSFKKGDLFLEVRWPMILTHKSKGKFEPKWKAHMSSTDGWERERESLITIRMRASIMTQTSLTHLGLELTSCSDLWAPLVYNVAIEGTHICLGWVGS